MKTMKNFLSMAALALVGAMTVGCSSDDNIIDTPQQPVAKSNVVTMTTTVGLDGGAATRALTADGKKTFAAGDKIAVVYENTGGTKVKAETDALTTGDITDDGKTAKFTVTLTDPKASGTLKYIYPAAMAGETDVDYTKLNSQDGTLDNLATNLDLAVFDGNLTAEAALPASVKQLNNQFAILAITLEDNATTPNDLTNSTTALTVSDGTNTYNVNPSTGVSPIYVAIRPTSSANITITATAGAKKYGKYLTSKTYAASNGYSVKWEMYKMAASAEPGDLEKLLCTAGHIHANGADAKCTATRVAKIFYVGSDAETSTSNTTFKHGLALALMDAGHSAFCNQTSAFCLSHQYSSGELSNDLTGIDNTDELVNHATHSHDAAKIARKFKYADDVVEGAHPSGTSEWFLPSAGQWNKMMSAAGDYSNLATNAGLSVSGTDGYYWSSTECSEAYAWRYFFRDGNWSDTGKTTGSTRLIRACLAF